MKIFFVARGWPSEREPQWGCFERDQALALKALGHHVVVMSVDRRFRNHKRFYGVTKRLNDGIPHYDFFAGGAWGKVIKKVSFNLYIKLTRNLFLILLKKVIKQEGMPDLIYSHYLGNSSIALAAKQKYGMRIVGIEHWSELGYEDIRSNVKCWTSRVYKDLDYLFTVSASLRENIKKNLDIDSVVVNNMVGSDFFYVTKEKVPGMVRFISTGNLLPVKGFDNLINAFARLGLPPDTWVLNIVGEGKEHDNLQELINRLHLEQNVHLCGRKKRDGVVDLLHNSDVYIMSSRSETFGVAAIEALACGLPVIATDCGGARDFLTKENGVMCPVNDVYKLAEAILHMYKCCQDFDGKKIAEDCKRRFSSEAIGKQLEGLFEEIIRNNKKQ